MSKPLKYLRPDFAAVKVTQKRYEKWLHGRAVAHVRRDRRRGNPTATTKVYKTEIHGAVLHSGGLDHYTGESLDWSLLGRYSNAEAKARGRRYKATLALLPSVDHVGDGLGEADFKLCAWRTNDSKSDLTHDEFVALCRRVVAHHDAEPIAG
jgi:hypothetical protein